MSTTETKQTFVYSINAVSTPIIAVFSQEEGTSVCRLECSKCYHEKSNKKQQMGMWSNRMEPSPFTCKYLCQCSEFSCLELPSWIRIVLTTIILHLKLSSLPTYLPVYLYFCSQIKRQRFGPGEMAMVYNNKFSEVTQDQ